MYYHVLIETTEKVGKNGRNKSYFERDKTDLSEIKKKIVEPFLNKEGFQFDGYFLHHKEIRRLIIRSSEQTTSELLKMAYARRNRNVFVIYTPESMVMSDVNAKDITQEVFEEVKRELSSLTIPASTPVKKEKKDREKIFIVHGHDDLAKTEVARFVEKLGFTAIILHEQPSAGKTIIEKIEEHSNVGFALVLYTPCDEGRTIGTTDLQNRARQNVVFEHGYLIGKLGRPNVCALVKDKVETPSDIDGIVYIPLESNGAWHIAVAKELRKAGYSVDMNKII